MPSGLHPRSGFGAAALANAGGFLGGTIGTLAMIGLVRFLLG